ncbi:MAG: PilN domain-containing protein [Halanaerobium sp.]
MRVNLLEKDEGIKIQWLEIVVVIIIFLILAAPALNYYLNYIEVQNLEKRRDDWNTRLKALRPEEEYYFELEDEIANFKLPEQVELEKYTVSPFFLEFARITEDDISFNNLDYSSGQITINGNAENVRSLLDFSSRIFESDIFSIISLERFQNNEQLEFNLEVELNNRERGEIYNE